MLFFCLFTLTATTVTAHICGADHRRTKFVHGKGHFGKNSAGIVLIADDAFLVGNAIFGGVYHDLSGSFDAYHREDAEADQEILHAGIIAEIAANAVSDTGRHFIHVTAMAAVAFFLDFNGKCDRIYGFNHNGRQITTNWNTSNLA